MHPETAARKAFWILPLFLRLVWPQVDPAEPWIGQELKGSPEAWLAAARKIPFPKSPDVAVLLDDEVVRYDAAGRKTQARHLVYLLLTPRGAENWATMRASYRPWCEERPSLAARVITRDGAAHLLDASTLTETQVGREGEAVYSDRRNLMAPLPAVAEGALVEEYTVTREHRPFFEAGESFRRSFGFSVPCHRTRFTLIHPRGRPIRTTLDLVHGVSTNETLTESERRVRFVLEPLPARENILPFLPSEQPRGPMLELSAARQWSDVAQAYHRLATNAWAPYTATLSKSAPPPDAGRRLEAIFEAAKELHATLRYTGVEFGENAIIPRSPEACLKARYGDCKEKSSYLVSLLARRGIAAQLALVRTGPDQDLNPAMPGLGLFDHAIVYLPGPEPLWIDATAEWNRPGMLPSMVQNRWALVIHPSTVALVRTPATLSATNVRRGEFLYTLAPLGPAALRERTLVTGTEEASYREYYGTHNNEAIAETLERYGRERFLAQQRPRFGFTDPRAFDQPFALTLDFEKTARAQTELMEASVALPVRPILTHLAEVFTEPEEDRSESAPSNREARSLETRTDDWQMAVATVNEWSIQIVPPAGFKAKSLPENERRNLGPCALERRFEQRADGAVEVRFRFDMGPQRFTAEEGRALRAAVLALYQEDIPVVSFVHRGFAALESGQGREALDLFRKLARENPAQPVQWVRLSRAFLECGLVGKARDLAREAVRLDSNSVLAWENLGWVSQFNRYGNRLKPGMDYAGACAAYARARELESNHLAANIDGAVLLEHDSNGVRYGEGASLEKAAACYLAVRDQLGDEFLNNLPLVYLHDHRLKECLGAIRKIPNAPASTKPIALAALAMKDGAPAAVKQAARDFPDSGGRSKGLEAAANALISCREYGLAAQLLEAAARGVDNTAMALDRAALLRGTARIDGASFGGDNPRESAQRFLSLLFAGDGGADRLSACFSASTIREYLDPIVLQALQRQLGQARAGFILQGIKPAVGRDLALATGQAHVDGESPRLARVRLKFPQNTMTLFLVREDGHWMMLDSIGGHRVSGREALAFIGRGELDEARLLLDWVREECKDGKLENEPCAAFFPGLWASGQAPEADFARVAAAGLAANSKEAPEAVEILEKALQDKRFQSRRSSIHLALAQGYQRHRRWNSLLKLARSLLSESSDPVRWGGFELDALAGLQRWPEAEKAALDAVARETDKLPVQRAAAALFAREKKYPEAVDLMQRITKHPQSRAADWNSLAWYMLFLDPVPAEALEAAQKANSLSQNRDLGALHTLCTVLAETGRTREARPVMTQLHEWMGGLENEASVWYLVGRLAEQYGEADLARQVYRDCLGMPLDADRSAGVDELARKRLKMLGP